jgi:hypothetical protein
MPEHAGTGAAGADLGEQGVEGIGGHRVEMWVGRNERKGLISRRIEPARVSSRS